MKKLYIIRHAKSSWTDMTLGDYERPLNKRGQGDAPFMGRLLKDKGVIADLIISSPALRAKTTAELIAKEIKYNNKILLKEKIYEADVGTLHKILSKIDDMNSIVLIIGHNPAINDLAKKYVSFSQNIPTCGIIGIEFDCISWKDIDNECAKFICFEYPKKYKEKRI